MYAVMRRYGGAPQFFEELAHRHAELFDRRVWWPWVSTPNSSGGRVPLDVYSTDDGYVVEAELPGLNQETIDLQMVGDTLAIRGEYQAEALEGRQYLVRQRQAGTFQTSITLPASVDASKIAATYEHGVLRLSIPKSEAARPTRIPLTPGKLGLE